MVKLNRVYHPSQSSALITFTEQCNRLWCHGALRHLRIIALYCHHLLAANALSQTKNLPTPGPEQLSRSLLFYQTAPWEYTRLILSWLLRSSPDQNPRHSLFLSSG